MNWLIYIGGWWLGEILIGRLIYKKRGINDGPLTWHGLIRSFDICFSWGLVWCWICWKFIR